MWSRGPSHTADLFSELRKQTSLSLGGISVKDPDLQKIAKIGTVGDADELVDEAEDQDSNFKKYLPLEFLKKLPGVDSHNINQIIKHAKNITELCKISEEELKKIIGPKNGRELKLFLEKKVEILKP